VFVTRVTKVTSLERARRDSGIVNRGLHGYHEYFESRPFTHKRSGAVDDVNFVGI
jgi:hypothetical protein